MTKTLVQHGNSSALIMDKAILELLNINLNTPLEITTDGKSLIISPVESENSETDIMKSLSKINGKFGRTLKKLGE